MKNEIILFENQNVKLEVNLKDETVWLNRQQMIKLFERDVKTIGKHITNLLNEKLKGIAVVANFATTASDFYDILYKNGVQAIHNNTLAALTLLIAESNLKEKEILVDLVMNF